LTFNPGDPVLFKSTPATLAWGLDGRYGVVERVLPIEGGQLCFVRVAGTNEVRKTLSLHLAPAPLVVAGPGGDFTDTQIWRE